jgi:superfamily II DNA/RNA helicase
MFAGGQDPLAGIPDPVERFEDFPGVSAGLLRSFREQGFSQPTPIQVATSYKYYNIFLTVNFRCLKYG